MRPTSNQRYLGGLQRGGPDDHPARAGATISCRLFPTRTTTRSPTSRGAPQRIAPRRERGGQAAPWRGAVAEAARPPRCGPRDAPWRRRSARPRLHRGGAPSGGGQLDRISASRRCCWASAFLRERPPNELALAGNYRRGLETIVRLWDELGRMGRTSSTNRPGPRPMIARGAAAASHSPLRGDGRRGRRRAGQRREARRAGTRRRVAGRRQRDLTVVQRAFRLASAVWPRIGRSSSRRTDAGPGRRGREAPGHRPSQGSRGGWIRGRRCAQWTRAVDGSREP